jgi:predicted nucleic acid-binding protein
MIAATALRHDAIVVTGNPSDFAPTGASIENPF